MLRLALKRVVKAGYMSFRRNDWLSAATIMVMVLVLFVLGSLILVSAFMSAVLASFESKIDISMYFVKEASEERIIAVKRELEQRADVAGVFYVSKEEALNQFREKHKENTLISEALSELEENPLAASLNIRARDPSNYASISDFLIKKNYALVEKINYFENKFVIDRLGGILKTVRGGGAFLGIFLAFIAVLVAFNTIRLAIYTMREEIRIMRLVGASSWFIRAPFLVSGVIYGTVSAVFTTILFFPLNWLASPRLILLLPNFDVFQYFISNFWEFFGIMFLAGIILGVLSSLIAIRRYLEA